MGRFDTIYSQTQRDAVVAAYSRPGVTAGEVSDMAAAGALPGADGEPLDAFALPPNTVRDFKRRAARARAGDVQGPVADLPAREATENLRRRLIAAADAELKRLERLLREGKSVSAEQLRQIARAVREAAALAPASGSWPPPRPGAKVNGHRDGSETRGGLAGDLLRDHRGSAWTGAVADLPELDLPEVPEVDDLEELEVDGRFSADVAAPVILRALRARAERGEAGGE